MVAAWTKPQLANEFFINQVGLLTERVQRSDAVRLQSEQPDDRVQPASVERSAVALVHRVSAALELALALAGKLKRSFGPAPWRFRFGAT